MRSASVFETREPVSCHLWVQPPVVRETGTLSLVRFDPLAASRTAARDGTEAGKEQIDESQYVYIYLRSSRLAPLFPSLSTWDNDTRPMSLQTSDVAVHIETLGAVGVSRQLLINHATARFPSLLPTAL